MACHRLAAGRRAVRVRAAEHTLATALKEYGTLRRTVYACYLSDPDYRRKIS
nr:transposase [Nocardia sp. CY41]